VTTWYTLFEGELYAKSQPRLVRPEIRKANNPLSVERIDPAHVGMHHVQSRIVQPLSMVVVDGYAEAYEPLGLCVCERGICGGV